MDIPGLGNNIPCVVKETVPIVTMDNGQVAEDGCVYVYPHYHTFRNLPLTLSPTYEAMRGSASGIDGTTPLGSQKIENGLTCPEVKYVTDEKMVGLQNQLKTQTFASIQL